MLYGSAVTEAAEPGKRRGLSQGLRQSVDWPTLSAKEFNDEPEEEIWKPRLG